jgi:tetratricopeptide (TPR) repeat protein
METENKKINDLIDKYTEKKKWKELSILLSKEIKKDKNNYWFLINYSISLSHLGFNYRSLIYSTKSVRIEDKDPFILYHHGAILMYNKKFYEAINTWEKALEISDDDLFYGKFGFGKRWGLSLKIDMLYYVGLNYFYLNRLSEAIKYYKAHLKSRRRGIPSNITKKQVEKELFEITSLANLR